MLRFPVKLLALESTRTDLQRRVQRAPGGLSSEEMGYTLRVVVKAFCFCFLMYFPLSCSKA